MTDKTIYDLLDVYGLAMLERGMMASAGQESRWLEQKEYTIDIREQIDEWLSTHNM